MQREIYLFGLPIIRVKKFEGCEKRYCLGVQYKVKRYAQHYDLFPDAFEDNVKGIHHRKIRVILGGIGESLVYARTAHYWYQPDELLFCTRPQHVELFRMYAPHIPVFYCGWGGCSAPVDVGDNHFDALLYDKELIRMNNRGKPFLRAWEERLNADFSTLSFSPAVISPREEQSMLAKAKALKINLENFVFLVPRARSCETLPDAFWKEVEHSLRARGFDVLTNSIIFSIPEAYILARHAKAIIALRNGLCDVLSELPVPQFIIYSHNHWHGDLQPMYSFKHFPWAAKKHIREYNVLHQDTSDVQNNIFNHI